MSDCYIAPKNTVSYEHVGFVDFDGIRELIPTPHIHSSKTEIIKPDLFYSMFLWPADIIFPDLK